MDEAVLGTRHIYDGKVVKLRVDRVRLADGRESEREVVEHSGAVAIVALDPEDRVIMVRQFRTPARRELLELPAGTLDADEDPATAAQRELQEEVGYKASKLRRIAGFWVAPGYDTEFITVFVAEDLSESRLDADEDEAIEVERYSLADALDRISSGEIQDAKTIIGLLAYAREQGA